MNALSRPRIAVPCRYGLAALLVTLMLPSSGFAQDPMDVSELRTPSTAFVAVDPALRRASGQVSVWVTLVDPSLAEANGRDAKKRGGRLTPDQQRAHVAALQGKQNSLATQISGLGGVELGRVQKGHNAIAVSIDASRIPDLARLPGVRSVQPVIDPQMDLSETVPWVGAAAVQAAGFDGTGVRVAVLDSGIDYTHRNLGGPGTVEAFEQAYGEHLSPKHPRNRHINNVYRSILLFPTAKVVGGFDFVGEFWPNGPLAPDPNPIDIGTHGTHVADIIAGRSTDGTHKGVAPGASLYAVKVCASFSTACSGIAILEGIDFALDPNGDGDISDAVDVINMSLGASYGQTQNPLNEAVENAVAAGVVVVAASSNSGDKPYVTSSPASATGAISVAQTHVPSAFAVPLRINSPAAIAGTDGNTATVDWAPIGNGFTGDVAFVGRGCPAGSDPPVPPDGDAYLANPAGKVALIDRGACNISLKVDRAAKAGAIGVLLGLVAPGDAVSFSSGGGDTFVPTLVITQARSNTIKANIAAPVNVTVSEAFKINLALSMVSTSSRGPNYSGTTIKPDIGAPGASRSAIAGTGTGEEPFGGTSGATPMIAGGAALLLQAFPAATPKEIKARLSNAARTDIQINPAVSPGLLAPITRIGGGELRVDRALALHTAAWDADTLTPSLSFGYKRLIAGPSSSTRTVVVRNYSATPQTYSIGTSFRYADDAATGAVSLSAPSNIVVPPQGTATFNVTLNITNPTLLPTWTLNGGASGGDGSLLRLLEDDGFVTISGAGDTVRLPWHILPHKAAHVTPAATSVALVGGAGTLPLSNAGAARSGRVDVFALTGTSPQSATPIPGLGDGFALVDLQSVGARLVSIGGGQFGVQFAITTFGTRTHPNYPAEFDVYIDANRDGTPDFVVFNAENGGFAATGQNVVGVFSFATRTTTVFFFTDADLNSSNVILTAPLSALGLTPSTMFDFQVFAFDNYFTGALTDASTLMTHTLGTPKFVGSLSPASPIPAGGSATLNVFAVPGGAVASPSQTGLLLMYRDGLPGRESDQITVSGATLTTSSQF